MLRATGRKIDSGSGELVLSGSCDFTKTMGRPLSCASRCSPHLLVLRQEDEG